MVQVKSIDRGETKNEGRKEREVSKPAGDNKRGIKDEGKEKEEDNEWQNGVGWGERHISEADS